MQETWKSSMAPLISGGIPLQKSEKKSTHKDGFVELATNDSSDS